MTSVPTVEHIPSTLIDHEQWVCWQTENRDGKQTKIPIDPTTGRYASTTESSTWATFEAAREYAIETADTGLGFVFTDDDPFVGVDLDNCRDEDGDAPAWATTIIDRLDSYTEISPSGTGYHIIVTGELPPGPNRRGDVECYETARYFTVTGESVHEPARPVAERTAELAAVHAEHVASDEKSDESTAPLETDRETSPSTSTQTAATRTSILDDETVIEKARTASNGPKFEWLWNGSTNGYDSHSEADMALCFMLAFWTGGDTAQMDRLFRQSGLLRAKWDDVHFSDGSTYGEKTIERAVARVDDVYDPTPEDDQSQETSRALPPEPEVGVDANTTSHELTSDRDQHEQRLMNIIDQLEARVDELEAENEALREELQSERNSRGVQQDASEEIETDTTSLWNRMTSRFGKNRDG